MRNARRRTALCFGVAALLVVCGLASCVPPFSPRLARTPSGALSQREARSFFQNSPFCGQSKRPLFGLLSREPIAVELSACWVSASFRERRRELLKRRDLHWPRHQSAVSLAIPAPSDAAAKAPGPQFLLAPFAEGLGLWPTDPQAALAATRQVGLAAAPGADFALDLNEDWGPGDALQIDLALRVEAGEGVAQSCLAALLGQTAARGLSLVRPDGAERVARRFVILGLGQGSKGVFGPLFIRAWFARFEANGAAWLGDFPQKATLRVSLPKGAGEACLGRLPGQPVVFESLVNFDLAGIRRLSHSY